MRAEIKTSPSPQQLKNAEAWSIQFDKIELIEEMIVFTLNGVHQASVSRPSFPFLVIYFFPI